MNRQFAAGQYVAISTFRKSLETASMKRLALLFDRIAIPFAKNLIKLQTTSALGEDLLQGLTELDWLIEQGIVADVDLEEMRRTARLPDEGFWYVRETYRGHERFSEAENRWLGIEYWRHRYRSALSVIEYHHGAHAIPLLDGNSSPGASSLRGIDTIAMQKKFGIVESAQDTQGNSKFNTLRVVINAIPEPNDATPWERIMEFRQEEESRRTKVALHRWVRKLSKESFSPNEIAEELEYLASEYEHYMEVHRIEARRGTFEAVVVGAAEVLENVAKVQLGKLAERCFSSVRKTDLVQAELAAPGRDVAYVVKARRSFGS
jgi:hypothetical protein